MEIALCFVCVFLWLFAVSFRLWLRSLLCLVCLFLVVHLLVCGGLFVLVCDFVVFVPLVVQICSTSPPDGNQVDGLPLGSSLRNLTIL